MDGALFIYSRLLFAVSVNSSGSIRKPDSAASTHALAQVVSAFACS
jgi:hypothetical protein